MTSDTNIARLFVDEKESPWVSVGRDGYWLSYSALSSQPCRWSGLRAATLSALLLRVLQMNLCNSGKASCYTGRALAQAAVVIRAEEPDVVTLNEVCHNDIANLGQAMARRTRVAPS